MPKVDPRNEVGAIVHAHAVSDRVLSDHTAKNIYGNVNVNYANAKTFLQDTLMNVFDRGSSR